MLKNIRNQADPLVPKTAENKGKTVPMWSLESEHHRNNQQVELPRKCQDTQSHWGGGGVRLKKEVHLVLSTHKKKVY